MKHTRNVLFKVAVMLLVIALLETALVLSSCTPKASQGSSPATDGGNLSVLVYITGMVAGSPTYELMAAGAGEFAAAHSNVTVKVYEAGFNQAEWEEQLSSLVASGEYDLVLGSNPSLPEICANVGKNFPNQKFVITDAELTGNPQIRTYLFNQYEQSLYLGYLAGLITTSGLPGANPAKLIGFIAAQEYPLLNKHIVPGFLDGARRVDPAINIDLRIIGNWSDANKAADLARSMISAGVDVFGSIAGGAAQGIIRTAQEQGAYVVFHNNNEYATAPGVILGCGIVQQKKLTEEILADALEGKIVYSVSQTVGVAEGYLDFITGDPLYTNYVPQDIQDKMGGFMDDFRAGRISYTLPPL